MQNDYEMAHERDCVSSLRGSLGWIEFAQSFTAQSVCRVMNSQLFLRALIDLLLLVLSHLQGEVPEHSAPGGGHVKALVSSYPHAACVDIIQQHDLHYRLPPRYFQFHPTAQAQGSATYSS